MQDRAILRGPVSFGMQYRANRAVVARSKITLLTYGFFVGLPVLVFVGLLISGRDITRPSAVGLPTWMALLAGPLFVFLFLPLCHALNVWQARRRNASLQGILTWTISPEGFESHGGTFDVRLQWNGINRVIETKEFFLIYIAASTAHFVPKVCAISPGDLKATRAIVKGALGNRAKLLSN